MYLKLDLALNVVIFFTWICISTSNGKYYKQNSKGNQVLRVIVTEENNWRFQNLQSSFPYKVELWGISDLYVPKQYVKTVTSELNENGFQYETMVPDMDSLLEEVNELDRENRRHHRPKRSIVPDQIIGIYPNLSQIENWLEEIGEKFPDLVSVTTIGTTYGGRNITLLKIGVDTGQEKPAIWVDGGIHAREWISPASVIYVIYSLINGYYSDENSIILLLEKIDWFMVPLVNPDGYVYSHNWDRFWRKNVSPDLNDTGCLGVDLNRNFDFQWGGASSSTYQCSAKFSGPHPASELETQAVTEAVMERRDQIAAFITVHSYAQLLLTRWSYTNVTIEDHDQQILLGNKAAAAIKEISGYNYTAGVPYKVLYPYSGGSSDWARAVAGIKYTYCIELRDKGKYNFLLPEVQIIPVGQELFAALKVIAKEILSDGVGPGDESAEERSPDRSGFKNGSDKENPGHDSSSAGYFTCSIGALVFHVLFTKLLLRFQEDG